MATVYLKQVLKLGYKTKFGHLVTRYPKSNDHTTTEVQNRENSSEERPCQKRGHKVEC